MGREKAVDNTTVIWWKELKEYKKDNQCCNVLKEGALEEHLKLAFDDLLPIKFSVNYCCQCGNSVNEEYEKRGSGRGDWCCRVMGALSFEKIVFTRAGKEIFTAQITYCFHCGRELKKHSGEGKARNREKDDKSD